MQNLRSNEYQRYPKYPKLLIYHIMFKLQCKCVVRIIYDCEAGFEPSPPGIRPLGPQPFLPDDPGAHEGPNEL